MSKPGNKSQGCFSGKTKTSKDKGKIQNNLLVNGPSKMHDIYLKTRNQNLHRIWWCWICWLNDISHLQIIRSVFYPEKCSHTTFLVIFPWGLQWCPSIMPTTRVSLCKMSMMMMTLTLTLRWGWWWWRWWWWWPAGPRWPSQQRTVPRWEPICLLGSGMFSSPVTTYSDTSTCPNHNEISHSKENCTDIEGYSTKPETCISSIKTFWNESANEKSKHGQSVGNVEDFSPHLIWTIKG